MHEENTQKTEIVTYMNRNCYGDKRAQIYLQQRPPSTHIHAGSEQLWKQSWGKPKIAPQLLK